MKKINSEIIVAGSGIAGLYYALKCAVFSKVLIITKGNIGESNTMFAQGGIAAAFGDNDSVTSHKHDTLVTGDGLCNEEAVDIVVSHAPQCILDLQQLSVSFDKNLHGGFDLHKEGGHSVARVVHKGDATGKEVENSLVKAVLSNKNITVYENCFVIDLLVEENTCYGIMALDIKQDDILEIKSKVVMLATGGAGQIYSQNTNPAIATGDGYAIANRAGAEMMNMEFVQFHPTVLYPPAHDTFLITEALRGFGAEFKNKKGETFMENYHPMKSLAPRDIVSRAITSEMSKTGDPCVFLDLKGFDEKELTRHFPNIIRTFKENGIDIHKSMVPVIPAAHYMCGGVAVDLNAKTTVENLYACGEVACTGLHGANRLASNSLLEGLVFAQQAAADTKLKIEKLKFKMNDLRKVENEKFKVSESFNPVNKFGAKFKILKAQLQKTMWKNAGIIRNWDGLMTCSSFLMNSREMIAKSIIEEGINIQHLELLNMVETATMVANSALHRKESRGCHFRDDYSEKMPVAQKSKWTEVLQGDYISMTEE